MRYFYTLLFYLLLPFILLRLLWRAQKAPAYAKRWAERFGYIKNFPRLDNSIWIHAVSLGEVLAAAPLIKALQKQFPEQAMVVTTLTPTGSERVHAIFNSSVYHVYAPYDLPDAIARFLTHCQPKLLVIIETEIWPNIIHSCAMRKIPLLIANGRLSKQSAQGYQRFASLTQQTLAQVTHLAVQTQAEAERFIGLGMQASRITVTGNIKFDIEIPANVSEQAQQLKQQWGADRPVWIAASTHQSEDEVVLAAFKIIRQQFPQLLLILVPRHPERFNQVASLCLQQGFSITRRSENVMATVTTDIFLGDTLGELLLFYHAADIAFVGGSLVPVGGHNLLEPAAVSIPTLTGPNMFNFLEINRMLQAAGAVFKVTNSQQMAEQILRLLNNPANLTQAGRNALQVIEANRGSLKMHLQLISDIIAKKIG